MANASTLSTLVQKLFTFLWTLTEEEYIVLMGVYTDTIPTVEARNLANEALRTHPDSEILQYVGAYALYHLDELPDDLWEDILYHAIHEVAVPCPLSNPSPSC